MCGFVGQFNWGDRATLERMVEIQRHRGPDDGGVEWLQSHTGQSIGLGSRRLAILDLSAAGHMPMWSEDRSVCLAYNGEIYNFAELRSELQSKGYHFRSRTDTEVLLNLYREEGVGCVSRLNGMFSFVLWDAAKQHMFMARDPFGIKPFYYAYDKGRFACASEMKALFELPGFNRELNLESLHRFLTFLWVPEPATILKQVQKLPAGHYALVNGDGMKITQYWDLEFPEEGASFPIKQRDLVVEVADRFEQAVKSQMISDRPVGAFLSAGLDSSSIVAIAAKCSHEPLRTYTITFPDRHRIGESTLDDPAVAARLARKLGCEHRELVLEPDVASLLPKLVWHMDEPVADPAIITSYAVCSAAASESTVLLSGIGGDEIFAGYRKHCAHYWARSYRKIPHVVREGMVRRIVERLPSLRGSRLKGAVRLAKKMVRSGSLPDRDRFIMDSVYLNEQEFGELCSPDLLAQLDTHLWSEVHDCHFERVGHADFLNQMLYLDTKVFMPSLNLNYNDKMSMASSIEVRVPFLDREFVEFVATHVPPRLKLRRFPLTTTKYLLREAMSDRLPQEVLRQPKAGFAAPVDHWLAHDLAEMVDDLLTEDRIRQRGLFRPNVIRRMIDEHRLGTRDWSMQIWQLITLELWMQSFLDAAPDGASSSSHTISV